MRSCIKQHPAAFPGYAYIASIINPNCDIGEFIGQDRGVRPASGAQESHRVPHPRRNVLEERVRFLVISIQGTSVLHYSLILLTY